jgi:hypothetical protein
MLFSRLDKLRQKPKIVRQQYAFFGALTLTAVVAGVWTLSLPARFAGVGEVATATDEAAPPFAHIFGELKDRFGAAKNQVGSAVETMASSTTEVVATTSPELSPVEQAVADAESTSTPRVVKPAPVPVLIATTSVSVSSTTETE